MTALIFLPSVCSLSLLFLSIVFLFSFLPAFLFLLFGGLYWCLLSLTSIFLFLLFSLYQFVFSKSLLSVLFSSVSLALRNWFFPSISLLSSFLLQPTTPHTTISLACFLSYPEFLSWVIKCSVTSLISSCSTSLWILLNLLTSSLLKMDIFCCSDIADLLIMVNWLFISFSKYE